MKALFLSLAKVLLKLAMDKALQEALPKIYKQIDAEVPKLLFNQAPAPVIENVISNAIVKNTHGKASKEMLELVIMSYDPIKAALHNRR